MHFQNCVLVVDSIEFPLSLCVFSYIFLFSLHSIQPNSTFAEKMHTKKKIHENRNTQRNYIECSMDFKRFRILCCSGSYSEVSVFVRRYMLSSHTKFSNVRSVGGSFISFDSIRVFSFILFCVSVLLYTYIIVYLYIYGWTEQAVYMNCALCNIRVK